MGYLKGSDSPDIRLMKSVAELPPLAFPLFLNRILISFHLYKLN